MRLLSPNAERSFYLSRAVADTIDTCPLIKMLCAHSMQAGHTLNVLYELDRIGEVKSQCGYQGERSTRLFCREGWINVCCIFIYFVQKTFSKHSGTRP